MTVPGSEPRGEGQHEERTARGEGARERYPERPDGESDDEDWGGWFGPVLGGGFDTRFDLGPDGGDDDERFDGFDGFGPLTRAGAGPTVGFAFDLEKARFESVFTRGLWPLGVPELFLRPPPGTTPTDPAPASRFAFFLAGGLIQLGYRLIAATSPATGAAAGRALDPEVVAGVRAYETELDGRTVHFWPVGPEAPDEHLVQELGPEVTTVIRVDCSLWHAPLLGG
jgi:hypothetical protein